MAKITRNNEQGAAAGAGAAEQKGQRRPRTRDSPIQGEYRSRPQIIYDILRVIRDTDRSELKQGQLGSSRIMFGAYLSWQQLGDYVPMLLEVGFVASKPLTLKDGTTVNPNAKYGSFTITEAGLEWMAKVEEMLFLMNSDTKAKILPRRQG